MEFNNIIIVSENGYYVALTQNKEFICSGDTYNECYKDAIEIMSNEK